MRWRRPAASGCGRRSRPARKARSRPRPGRAPRRHRPRRRGPLARGAQSTAAGRGAQAVRGAFLDEMAEASRERVRAAKQTRSESALEAAARESPTPPPLRLDRSGFDLIAEVKLRSPGSGRLGPRAEDVAARVTAYAGANPLLAGVNCRDLATLQVLPQRLLELAPLLPASTPRVAESGVATAADARQIVAAGYQLALVGGALMQAEDPQGLAGAVLAAGRAAAKAEAT